MPKSAKEIAPRGAPRPTESVISALKENLPTESIISALKENLPTESVISALKENNL